MFTHGEILNGMFQITADSGTEGSTSTIYKAVDLYTGESVIVKSKKDSSPVDLKVEFDLLVKLYPFDYSPRPLCMGNDPSDTEFFVVSDEGTTLFEKVFQNLGSISELLAFLILRHSLVGLKTIHDLGLCHGDISARNLTFNAEKGSIAFIDFGNCREYSQTLGRQDVIDLFGALRLVGRGFKYYEELHAEYIGDVDMTIQDLIKKISEKFEFAADEKIHFKE